MTAQTYSPALSASREAVRRGSTWFLVLGILWVVLGALAIIAPLAAALAIQTLIGVLLLVGGIAQIVHAFRSRGWGAFGWHLLSAVAEVVAGALLLFFPLQGVLTLTLILAALFIAVGVVKILAALRNRDTDGWVWLLVSGILSILVGLLIWARWPYSAEWAIGVLVGIEFIFSGWALIMIAMAGRRLTA
jgi:uncharacterized membrane protein HdeD (DUF308 family)